MDTIHTIGRRKASVARIYMSKGKGIITVNKKNYKDFFPVEVLQKKVVQPFTALELEGKFDVKVNVNGGGNTGQADAIKLAIARALCKLDEENRSALKVEGLLTRDSRVVERKKPGQKKARKKFQWVKR
ncbi:MAG: 30S ribosomal protein S9 [Flavobacteriales bacterium]|jgi:small subunit ribosomal protein S9|nr:30S ribosomal protein S9 [Flavobacteriales bacterium]